MTGEGNRILKILKMDGLENRIFELLAVENKL
jgi:hypothetical protein